MSKAQIDIVEIAKLAGLEVSDGGVWIDGRTCGVQGSIIVNDELRKFSKALIDALIEKTNERALEFQRGTRGKENDYKERAKAYGACESVAKMMGQIKGNL